MTDPSHLSAFLLAIAHDPWDAADVTRGVFADWLEERGDERAGSVRATQTMGTCLVAAAYGNFRHEDRFFHTIDEARLACRRRLLAMFAGVPVTQEWKVQRRSWDAVHYTDAAQLAPGSVRGHDIKIVGGLIEGDVVILRQTVPAERLLPEPSDAFAEITGEMLYQRIRQQYEPLRPGEVRGRDGEPIETSRVL